MPKVAEKPPIKTYEELCDESRADVEGMDVRRWKVGDNAQLIETNYGEHTMQDFARDIGMNKSTLAGWHRVAKFYPEIIRRKLLDNLANLTYSHYKDALRLENLDDAIAWLENVSGEGWSPDKASHELTIKLGRKPQTPSIPGEVSDVFKRDGMGIVEISIAIDDMDFIRSGSLVNLKPKEF